MYPELCGAIKRNCVRFGDFTLASGKQSSFYLDLRQVTLSHYNSLVCGAIISKAGVNNTDFDAVGGPETAANQIVGGMMVWLHPHHKNGFVVRKAVKDHGMKELVAGSVQPGDHCLLVEDVVTTGASLIRAAQAINQFGCSVVLAIAIVDRGEGAEAALTAAGIKYASVFTLAALGLTNEISQRAP